MMNIIRSLSIVFPAALLLSAPAYSNNWGTCKNCRTPTTLEEVITAYKNGLFGPVPYPKPSIPPQQVVTYAASTSCSLGPDNSEAATSVFTLHTYTATITAFNNNATTPIDDINCMPLSTPIPPNFKLYTASNGNSVFSTPLSLDFTAISALQPNSSDSMNASANGLASSGTGYSASVESGVVQCTAKVGPDSYVTLVTIPYCD